MNSCSIGATSCGHTSPRRPIVIAGTKYIRRYMKTMYCNMLSVKHFCLLLSELASTVIYSLQVSRETVRKYCHSKHGNTGQINRSQAWVCVHNFHGPCFCNNNKNKKIRTRLLSNLRHDHLRILHVIIGSYFRPHKKDDGHAIRLGEGENPILHAYFTAVCYRRRVIGDGIFTLRRSGFVLTRRHPLHVCLLWTFFGPVTLTLTQ